MAGNHEHQQNKRPDCKTRTGPPDPGNDSAAGARDTHGAKNIEAHSDKLNTRDESTAQAYFPVITGEWPKNKRESVRVALDEYQGRKIIDCRVWWRDDDGVLRPGKSGLTLAIKHAPALADALAKALVRARELGLVNDGGRE